MRNKLDEWDAAMAKPAMAKPEGEARRGLVPGYDEGLEDFVALITPDVGKEEAEAIDARIRADVEEHCAHLYYQDDGDGRPIPKGFYEHVQEERAALAARSRFQRYADAVRDTRDKPIGEYAIFAATLAVAIVGYKVFYSIVPPPDQWAGVLVFDWTRLPFDLYEWLTG